MLLLFTFLLQALSASSSGFPDITGLHRSCEKCVEKGCTWCLFKDQAYADGCYGELDTSNGGQCTERIGCEVLDAGSTSLASRWDCVFESEEGAGVLAVLILMPLGCLCACGCCCYWFIRCMSRPKRPTQESMPSSTSVPFPAETVPATAIQPIQIATPEQPPKTPPESHYETISASTLPPYYSSDSNYPYIMPVASWVVEPETPLSAASRPPATNPSYETEFKTHLHYTM